MVSLPSEKGADGLWKEATMVSLAGQLFWVTSSQYVPLSVTLIEADVALVLQRKVALVDVSLSTSVEPTQSVVSLPKCTRGGAFWITTIVSLNMLHTLVSGNQ